MLIKHKKLGFASKCKQLAAAGLNFLKILKNDEPIKELEIKFEQVLKK